MTSNGGDVRFDVAATEVLCSLGMAELADGRLISPRSLTELGVSSDAWPAG